MTKQSTVPFRPLRRRDRAIEDKRWIAAMLTRCPVGTLATLGTDGPSLNPNLFVVDPSAPAIYLHTAHQGQTRSNVEHDSRVAFSVHEMGRLLPAAAAVNFSAEFASVVVIGTATIIEDSNEARHALELLMRKYAPQFEAGRDYQGIADHDLARTSVFRIDIESWTGKGKAVDATDAYSYSPDASPDPHDSATRGSSEPATAMTSSSRDAFWAGIRDRDRPSDS